MKMAKYNGTYPDSMAYSLKLQGSKPEWCMNGYDNADETVIEDDEGVKLCLKQIRTEEPPAARYGDHGYW